MNLNGYGNSTSKEASRSEDVPRAGLFDYLGRSKNPVRGHGDLGSIDGPLLSGG